jgi:pimeloyl-ACP methyl ester carboxylesterase
VPDTRVQSAVEHWAPRFVQAGVDYSDFARTTADIERWEDWLDAWRALGDMHADAAREAETAARRITAGDAWLRAAVAYHFGKFVWVLDAGRSRAVADQAVEAMYAAHRSLDPTAERIEAPLDDAAVVGNLRRPALVERPPLVLLIPGLDSTKEEFFTLEEVFLRRGMATLSLDGPGQGECGYRLPIRPEYEVAVAAVLDRLDGRQDLDLEHVGALGVSLGGYYAPRAAAFEPRIRAVAGISGAFNFGALWDDLPELTRATFAHKSGAPDADDARERALALDLDGVLERLDRPALFVTGRRDRLIPWESTEQQALAAPQGELVVLEDGNHVCANVSYRARPLVADWLRDRLGS